jgi:AcrR family transcriptional regulator
MFEIPRLKIRERTGAYATGRERIVQILEAALDILLESGYRAVTLREIARRCGIRIGAVVYYYKSRDDLLQDLVNSVIASYVDIFDAIRSDASKSAERRLELVIELILDDIQTRKTTHFFPELWALATHDPFVAKAVDSIYIKARLVLNELIRELNPILNEEERETLALFVSASLEGLTVFAGHQKPWANQMPLIKAIACRSLIHTVKTVRREDLMAQGWAGPAKGTWRPPTLFSASEYAAIVAEAAGGAPPQAIVAAPPKRRAKAAR